MGIRAWGFWWLGCEEKRKVEGNGCGDHDFFFSKKQTGKEK
jgi:hypothetical protein